jgi:nitrite transporter NirC
MVKKSIFGGISIAIASYIYLQTSGILGALLFSIGLLLILNMNFKLFTGTIGYIKSKKDLRDNVIILFGNITGACGSLAFPVASASSLIATKLAVPLPLVFLKGIVCGIFIYSAVASFRKSKDYMVPVCVVGFITFGGEHCIADLCYILFARGFSIDILIFLIVVALGNAIGALMVDRL